MIKKTTLFFTGLLLLLPTWLWAQSVGPDIKHQRQAGSASGQLKQPIGPRSAVILPQLRRNHAPQPITLGPPAPVPQLKLDQYQRGPEGPTFLSLVMPPDLIQQTKSLPANEQAARTSLHYLRQNGFPSLPSELELMSEQTDAQGIRHVRFQQTAQGIEVYGADLWVHLYPDQRLIVNGRYQPQPAASLLVPSITGAEALQAAQVHFQQHQEIHALPFGWKKFLGYETVPTKLVVYMEKGYLRRQRLVYQVTLRPNVIERHELFVDAHTGEVIHEFDHTCSIAVTGTAQDLNGVNRTINLWRDGANYYAIDASRTPMYTGNGTTFPTEGEGVILTLDMNNTSGNNPNITYATSGNPNNWAPKVVSAHFNSGEAFEYFKQKFGRNAINGSGGDILSFINVADDDGQGLDNAYWNGAAMFYGNGRNGFDPLAGSLDVGGHEMSHGVIQETANLVYQDEPGALNESFADIFGVMIDRDDWFLGEDITRTSFIATGRLRDMSDPHNGGNSLADNGWQPSHMDERYTGSQDNGGVHINSGIPNHAYYLYATAIGKADAEQVFYDALTKFLTRSSEFIDARLAVVQAATDRFGANSSQVSAAKTAFDQVGIFNGAPNQPPPDFDPNPGDAYLVSTDYWTGDNGENLYVADAAGNFPGAFNVVEPRAKLSVRDDGAFGYYVGIDNHIYEIGLNPNDTQNFGQTSQLSNLPEWNSVAISKDGLKLAAITNFQDASIYVFDFSQASGVRSQIFDLYIPTTGQGNNSLAGVEYADAMDWDPLGEYLIYDSYVVLPNASGPDIDYWDINFMRVWDVNANDFGDGLIIPLFSNLEAGFSVGNPVFSKNSPYILAFDYFNLGTSTFYVISANIETNQINLISTNNTLGFPEFSVNDDQLVYNVANSSTGGSVYRINLAADKITPIGTGSEFISFASFGVWYATGTRVLSSIEDPHGDLPWQLYPNPSRGEITLSLELTRPSPIQISVADLTGRTLLREEQPGQVGKREYALSLSDLAQGTYLVRIEAGGQQWVQMIQRTY